MKTIEEMKRRTEELKKQLDWTPEGIASEIAFRMADYDNGDIQDVINEICDGMVDIYNADLLKWVAEDFTNAWYIDEAIKEYGQAPDFFAGIRYGQYMKYEDIGTQEYDTIVEWFALSKFIEAYEDITNQEAVEWFYDNIPMINNLEDITDALNEVDEITSGKSVVLHLA